MISFKVERDDTGQIVDLLPEAKQKALTVTARNLARLAEPYTKWRTGQTARSVNVASNFKDGEIVYKSPWAREAYYSENAKTDVHPNACKQWAEVAYEAKKDLLHSLFKKTLVKELLKKGQ